MLEAQAITALRGDRLVLDGITFHVAPGGALLLTGPNGAGKSTLLRLLAGLRRSDAGRLLWGGADVMADRTAHGARVAYLGHADAIKPGLTVMENLLFAAAGRAPGPALAAMGLASLAELPARMLSAGQRRRLALARLPLAAAPLWLLDEPTVGLDTASLDRLAAVLATHRAGGGVVVAATHQPIVLPGAATLAMGQAERPRGEGAPASSGAESW